MPDIKNVAATVVIYNASSQGLLIARDRFELRICKQDDPDDCQDLGASVKDSAAGKGNGPILVVPHGRVWITVATYRRYEGRTDLAQNLYAQRTQLSRRCNNAAVRGARYDEVDRNMQQICRLIS
jgi:hypothetical protein